MILVTGGNGFIGSWTVSELLGRGYEVLLFDRVQPKEQRVEAYWGDIRDPVAVTEAMAHATGWIHLAGVLGTQETIADPRPAVETNIGGAINVLEAASRYGIPGVNIAVGNYWMANPYSITKNTAERFCEMYREERDVRVSVVRALNAYGPGQSVAAPYGPSKVRKIMPSFIMRALHGEPIEIYGDGTQIMDMIFVSDVAEILVNALEDTMDSGALKHTVEAGTGRPTTVAEIAEMVVAEVGKGEVRHLPMRPGEPSNSSVLGDPKTLRGIFDPDDLISLEDGIGLTVKWFRDRV